MLIEKVISEVEAILPEIVNLRHQIHRNPELAGEEFKTAQLVRDNLKATSVDLLPPFLGTDVVGLLTGECGNGGNVTLRADMDALPLSETTGIEYASETPGRMHACGHDGHTAMLIGAAKVLDRLKSEFPGTVRFVFQPGEEVAALGKELVAAGALLNPEPELVCALHGYSDLPVGTIAAKPGAMMAAAGFFSINIKGKGGHGCVPHLTTSPLLIACRIVEALQSMPSGMIDTQKPLVVSVCHLSSGANSNVIPDTALIEGTVRFLNPELEAEVPPIIKQIADGICATFGAKCTFDFSLPYCPVLNSAHAVNLGRDVAQKYLGADSWQDLEDVSMGGEDFCYYLDKYPGMFCRLGLGEASQFLHNPNFNFNDQALRNGIIFFVATAIEHLNKLSQ